MTHVLLQVTSYMLHVTRYKLQAPLSLKTVEQEKQVKQEKQVVFVL